MGLKSSNRNIVEVKITVHAMFMASDDPLKVAFSAGAAARRQSAWRRGTSVGIKHVIGKKEIAPGRSNGRCASMNYHDICIANQALGKVFGLRSGYRCVLWKQSRTRGQPILHIQLAHPNYVVLFPGRAQHE